MILKQGKICPFWPPLVACLLLGAMATVLFGGIKGFENYRKSAAPNLPFNRATLHFFTKETIQRRYLGLTTTPLPSKTTLPSFRIYTNEQDLASLESNLPASAKTRFIPGHIKIDAPGLSSEIQFRYRGGLPLHWLYKKKSLRIKLPPYTTYRGGKSFNLVNPSMIPTVTDWVSYDMARSLGLLTPEFFPARVYINDRFNGLHFFLSQIDESFLRKNRRMPGSIYSGDTNYIPNPFGVDKEGVREISFKTEDGTSKIWVDQRLWKKDAYRNTESIHVRSDIRKFVDITNEEDPLRFMADFKTYFDTEQFYVFWGLDTLLGSYHHDNFHNHKIYFDPYKGKFEPIEWDIRFWSSIFLTKNLPVNSLLRQVILNPVLEYERDKQVYSLLSRFPVNQIINQIENANNIIRPELEADPFRQHPDPRYGRFEMNKEVPYAIKQYDSAIEELKMIYKSRHEFLQAVYKNTRPYYTLNPSNKGIVLTISVNGNSPIKFSPWSLRSSIDHSKINIKRVYNDTTTQVLQGDIDILYPGRAVVKGNPLGRADNWAILAFGRNKYVPAALHYQYLIEGINLTEMVDGQDLDSVNAITNNAIQIHRASELESTSETASVHPWYLSTQIDIPPDNVTLSGDIDITEDRIYAKETQVRILPGTVFKLTKGRSLIFYGKVLAEGTEDQPIYFKQSVEGEPWGSLVIQGKKASGSRLNNLHISGGSVTTHRLINYPGQLNIHDVESFELENCVIKQNHIGDDALHIAYSHGKINNCLLEDTAFDAIDIDIADINISNVKFNNIGNDALDLMTSNINIDKAFIDGAGDKCFSVGEGSKVHIQHSQLNNCDIGIAVKDESQAYVEHLKFGGFRQSAIALYRKNPRYGSGGSIDGKQLFGLSEKDIFMDDASINHIDVNAFHPLSGNKLKTAPARELKQ